MKINLVILSAVAAVALLLVTMISACGSGDDEGIEWAAQEASAAPAPASDQLRSSLGLDRPSWLPGNAGSQAPAGEPGPAGLPGSPGNPGSPGPQAPAAPVAMTAQAAVGKEVVKEVELSAPTSVTVETDDVRTQLQAQLVTQRRIIIRTVNMSIVVDEIQSAIDDISELADSIGGWVVSTDRREKHSGVISVRVPAADLGAAIEAPAPNG